MVSRDYTREVGLHSDEKKVSKPVATLIIVVFAGALVFAVHALGVSHETAARPAAPTSPPAAAHVAKAPAS